MPKFQRQDVYDRVKREEGAEALKQLMSKVSAEYKRKLEHAEAKGRTAAL